MLDTDLALVVAYCPELKSCLFSSTAGTRSTASATLEVNDFLGKTVHTWLAFLAVNGKEAPNSFYVCELLVK